VTERYEVINREEGSYPISSMCRWSRVSKSGYYSWRDRPESATTVRRKELGVMVNDAFEDSDGLLAKIHQTCEGLSLSIKAEMTFIRNPKVEDITSPGGHLACKLTSNEALGENVRFSENDDTYSFILPSMEIGKDYSDFKTRIVVNMPGKILKTNRGRIDRNKVIIDSFDFFYSRNLNYVKEGLKSNG